VKLKTRTGTLARHNRVHAPANAPTSRTARLRQILRRFVGRRRSYHLNDLVPGEHLRLGAQPGEWESTGIDPVFTLNCQIPPGWMKVAVEMDTPALRPIDLYLDTGRGFNPEEMVRIANTGRAFKTDTVWRVDRPVRAVRFDPLDCPGTFRLIDFSIKRISSVARYGQSTWRVLGKLCRPRQILSLLVKGVKALATGKLSTIKQRLAAWSSPAGDPCVPPYETWVARHTLTRSLRRQIRQEIKSWISPPKITVVMPAYNAPDELLRATIESVRKQLYGDWEFCIADDCSSAPHVRKVLQEYARRDKRIKLCFREASGGISAAMNSALELATGEFVAFVDSGDEYAAHALFRLARVAVRHPDVNWIYSDEDKLNAEGQRVEPFFKPDWSPELMLSYMYTRHLSAYRTSLVRKVGGLRSALDGAHDYDLALRMMARTERIRHIPDVLYHARMKTSSSWPGAEAKGHAASRKALEDYLRLKHMEGTVEPSPIEGCHRVRLAIHDNPLVSVVIPTASRKFTVDDRATWCVLHCVQSIRQQSTYKNIEIVVVDNNDMPADLAAALEPYHVKRISFTQQFNLSAKMNLGARYGRGEYVVFMNDDIEILSPDWVEGMLEHAQHEQVGAVGVKLLFPSGRIQHAGVLVMRYGPDHVFYNEPAAVTHFYPPSRLAQNFLSVTGACVMLKMSDHRLIGGWNEQMPLNFNDIDLCLKLVERGRRNVYSPYVQLRHYESVSKTSDDKVSENIFRECKVFLDLWLQKFQRDPYYNVNLIEASPYYRVNTLTSAEQLLSPQYD
jgi:glycosyltransferase involved in cell wall biosynthesis